MLKAATVDFCHTAVYAQCSSDGSFTIVVIKISCSDFHLAFQETQSAAIHEIYCVQLGVGQIVVNFAIVNHHLGVFGIQGTAMFARKVAKQVAMAYFHIVAIENAKGATILVVIKGGFTILEAAVTEFACIGFV